MRNTNHRRRRGNALIEFALCMIFLMPLYLWMIMLGLDLRRTLQTNQVCRDSGHMFARWVDFSQTGNQDLVVRLAYGMGITRTGGNGVVILTKVMKAGTAQCTAAGLTNSNCTNLNQVVAVQRFTIGNASYKPSKYVTPASNLIGSDGKITATNYLTKSSCASTNFPSVLALADGEYAYLSEAWFASPVEDFPTLDNRGPVYARSIF